MDVKPELASGFLIVGAPVMVADAVTLAAAGNVGRTCPIVDVGPGPPIPGPLCVANNELHYWSK